MAVKSDTYKIPLSVVSPGDLGNLVSQAETITSFLEQSEMRKPGQPTKLPRTGKFLDEMLEINDLNILLKSDRQELHQAIKYWEAEAPSVHMSFTTDPSNLVMSKLVTWFRKEIHPYMLIRIGLQPNIGAGFALRTNNKYFDFSLREVFNQRRELLTGAILEAGSPTGGKSDG